jgi:hypothetical protein
MGPPSALAWSACVLRREVVPAAPSPEILYKPRAVDGSTATVTCPWLGGDLKTPLAQQQASEPWPAHQAVARAGPSRALQQRAPRSRAAAHLAPISSSPACAFVGAAGAAGWCQPAVGSNPRLAGGVPPRPPVRGVWGARRWGHPPARRRGRYSQPPQPGAFGGGCLCQHCPPMPWRRGADAAAAALHRACHAQANPKPGLGLLMRE